MSVAVTQSKAIPEPAFLVGLHSSIKLCLVLVLYVCKGRDLAQNQSIQAKGLSMTAKIALPSVSSNGSHLVAQCLGVSNSNT